MQAPTEYNEAIADAFENELKRIRFEKVAKLLTKKNLGLMAGGAVAYEGVRRAEHDRKMGRAMRVQQGY